MDVQADSPRRLTADEVSDLMAANGFEPDPAAAAWIAAHGIVMDFEVRESIPDERCFASTPDDKFDVGFLTDEDSVELGAATSSQPAREEVVSHSLEWLDEYVRLREEREPGFAKAVARAERRLLAERHRPWRRLTRLLGRVVHGEEGLS